MDTINQNNPISNDLNLKKEMCKLFISNSILTQQINKLMNDKKKLQEEIQMAMQSIEQSKEQNLQMDNGMLADERKKKLRQRRFANQIDRKYSCKYQNCGKAYGSETSLSLHMKVKHQEELQNEDYKASDQQDISNDIDIQNRNQVKIDGQMQEEDRIEQMISIDLNR